LEPDVVRALFKSLVDSLSGAAAPKPEFAADDHRLAAAALLVHAMDIDHDASAVEAGRLEAILSTAFNLTTDETARLIEAAREADREAVDLYRFTSLLKRELDETGRLRVVEMLWEMVLVDGKLHEFEDNLIWRVADLMGVSTRDRVLIRREVADRLRAVVDEGEGPAA
jgi:uncharacterized tellurite resistance protein B-like protein